MSVITVFFLELSLYQSPLIRRGEDRTSMWRPDNLSATELKTLKSPRLTKTRLENWLSMIRGV